MIIISNIWGIKRVSLPKMDYRIMFDWFNTKTFDIVLMTICVMGDKFCTHDFQRLRSYIFLDIFHKVVSFLAITFFYFLAYDTILACFYKNRKVLMHNFTFLTNFDVLRSRLKIYEMIDGVRKGMPRFWDISIS